MIGGGGRLCRGRVTSAHRVPDVHLQKSQFSCLLPRIPFFFLLNACFKTHTTNAAPVKIFFSNQLNQREFIPVGRFGLQRASESASSPTNDQQHATGPNMIKITTVLSNKKKREETIIKIRSDKKIKAKTGKIPVIKTW